LNTAETGYLTVGDINVDVVYKDIKNLHIGVYPPVGRVRVAAPRHLDDEQVRLAVVKRLPWIRKHQRQLREAERQSEREMVNGESHYLWGRRLRLDLVPGAGRPRVEIQGNHLVLRGAEGADAATRARVLERFYRRQLQAEIRGLIEKWEPRIGRPVSGWTVRRMRTKWGSCKRETARLWFNLELAKKPPRCAEYMVVHEMVHLLERGHGERFVALMDHHLPDWRQRRDELNAAPLAAEDWAHDNEAA
jgi:predicted metal-dependent hydrolase